MKDHYLYEYEYGFEYPYLRTPKIESSRSKVKSYLYRFQNIADYRFSYHALQRMETRNVSSQDVNSIILYGRRHLVKKDGRTRVNIFLCDGEVPKGKSFKKTLKKLYGTVIVVSRDRPLIITVIRDSFYWKRQLYRYHPMLSDSCNGSELSPQDKDTFRGSRIKPLRDYRKISNKEFLFPCVQQMERLRLKSNDVRKILQFGNAVFSSKYGYFYLTYSQEAMVKNDECKRLHGMAVVLVKGGNLIKEILRVDPIENPNSSLSSSCISCD